MHQHHRHGSPSGHLTCFSFNPAPGKFVNAILVMLRFDLPAVRSWLQVVELAATEEKGGCKSASATISGQGVYGRLKFESGVHRVQRVPMTESTGRVHTSAASVAILPQADEVHLVPLSSCMHWGLVT